MKRATLLAFMSLAIAAAWPQKTAKKTESPRPIAALSWLVGGVWTADGSKVGPGMQRIETRYQWSDNGAYIRFNTHFVLDRGPVPTYDGNFFWNPDQSTLAIWYMDRQNSITEGPVTVEGDLTLISFRATDFSGKTADLRVKVIRKTNDSYNWVLEEKFSEGWKQLASLDYLRSAGS